MSFLRRQFESVNRIFDLGIDPDEVGAEVHRRVRLVSIATLAMFLVGFPALLQWVVLDVPAMVVGVAVTIAAAAGNLVLLRKTRQPRLAGHLALVCLASLLIFSQFVAGGFYDPDFAWFYLLPLGAAVVVGLRGAWTWTAVTLAITLAFWSLPMHGVEFESAVPAELQPLAGLFNRVTAILGVAIIATSFVFTERRAERELQLRNLEIEREVGFVQLLRHAAECANQSTHFESALHAGLDRICEVMDWPVGQLQMVGDEGELIPTAIHHIERPQDFAELAEASHGRPWRPDGLSGRVVRQGHADSADLRLEGSQLSAICTSLGLRTGYAVPVPVHGKVKAVLGFASSRPPGNDGLLLEVLSDVGAQLGLVAERAALQERLQQAQKMEAVGQLAAGIAHEINNPMSYVRSNLNHLREHCGAVGEAVKERPEEVPALLEECQELFEECQQGVERTIAIVRDVRDFSRAGHNEREPVDLAAVVDGAVRVAAAHAPPGVTVEQDLRESPPLQGSGNRLRQVIVNLVVNAIHAVGDTGTVRVTSKREAGEAVVSVADDGPGIDAATRERLFEPFFTTKPVGKGTGLGLYVSYEIVQNHGGELRVVSEPGQGATFEMRVPLEPA